MMLLMLLTFFIVRLLRLHGVLKSIVSDRDVKFNELLLALPVEEV